MLPNPFARGSKNKKAKGSPGGGKTEPNMSERANGSAPGAEENPARQPYKLVFHCQLAHGSPTGIISGFSNVKELYKRIAETYEMDTSEILFCTLNTHKVKMEKLLGGQIGLEDLIFVHLKGDKKEIDVVKTEEALGLTITDNGAGCAFIKRIKEDSVMARTRGVEVGDHIEKINGTSLVGCRHYEVAKFLKDIKKGSTFTIRLISPMRSGFSHIGPSGGTAGGRKSLGTGRETLRLRATGPATVEVADNVVTKACEKINGLLEQFMGINDTELAMTIWEVGSSKDNPSDFITSIQQSDLAIFGFSDDFIIDLWGCISDAKDGRLNKPVVADSNEQF